MAEKKALIIRFSSFGDINQCLYAALSLREENPNYKVHWLTRSDFSDYLSNFKDLEKIYSFNRKLGLIGLVRLALQLREKNFDLIYDAHNNLRSLIIRTILGFGRARTVVRSKNRWKRLLLFKFRKNLFEQPFRGGISFMSPLKKAGLISSLKATTYPKTNFDNIESDDFILIAPAATWPLKEWPKQKWIDYIKKTPSPFVIVGGPNDAWLQEIADATPEKTQNMAGQLSWTDSLKLVKKAKSVVGVDTGITHLADLLGKPCTFLIGPSAFGYPTRQGSHFIEHDLWCKPCTKDGRGKCKNKEFKKCMNLIETSELIL